MVKVSQKHKKEGKKDKRGSVKEEVIAKRTRSKKEKISKDIIKQKKELVAEPLKKIKGEKKVKKEKKDKKEKSEKKKKSEKKEKKVEKKEKKVEKKEKSEKKKKSVKKENSEKKNNKEKSKKMKKATKKDSESVEIKKTTPKESNRSKRFRKIEKITAEDRLNKGVIYLGHIPYGFREEEIKEFFSQFGPVTRLRIARSKKTARPKGYAFIEFESLAIAAVAAETTDNRFMFDRRLVCNLVEDDKVHKDLFKNSGRMWKYVPYQKINSKNINSDKTDLKRYKKVKRLLENESEKREKIQDFFNTIGKSNTFEFPGYKAIIEKSLQEIK